MERSIFDGVVADNEWTAAYQSWISEKKRTGSKNTAAAYDVAYRQFFGSDLPGWAPPQPAEVTPQLAEQWMMALLARSLSPASINLKLSAMASFYDFCWRIHLWSKANPFNLRRIQINPTERSKEHLTRDEALRILKSINLASLQGRRDFALLFLFLTSAAVSSAILNLKWGDLKQSEGGYVASYRKGKSKKRFQIGPQAYQFICDYLETAGRLATMRAEDYIFSALDPERVKRLRPDEKVVINRPIANSLANRILKKYAGRAGVEPSKAHLHELRHTGAHQLSENLSSENLADFLGIESLAYAKKYVEALTAEDSPAVNLSAIEEAFLPKNQHRRKQN